MSINHLKNINHTGDIFLLDSTREKLIMEAWKSVKKRIIGYTKLIIEKLIKYESLLDYQSLLLMQVNYG